MLKYNLINYRKNYAKALGRLEQYHKDIPNCNIGNSDSFNFKAQSTRRTPGNGNTVNVDIVLPLKHLSDVWRTQEMPLINCAINVQLSYQKIMLLPIQQTQRHSELTHARLYPLK